MKRGFWTRLLLILVLAVMLTGCVKISQTDDPPVVKPTTPAPAEPGPTSTSRLSPTITIPPPPPPSPQSPLPPRPIYNLDIQLNYQQRTARVSQQILYPNHDAESFEHLWMVVEPDRFPGAFQLHSLSAQEPYRVAKYALNEGLMEVSLDQALQPAEMVTLEMEYTLHFPDQRGVFGGSDRQINAGNSYPFIAPYEEDQGWLIHKPNPYGNLTLGEHLAYDKADFLVRIRLPEGDQQTIIAASAPAERGKETLTYRAENMRNFTWSASPDFQVEKLSWNQVNMESFFFPEHRKAALDGLEIMKDSLEIYSDTFALYPHAYLSMVEGDFPDGAEFEGLFFLSSFYYQTYDGTPYNYFTILTAHETAHQWWYGMVANDQALEPWLDEILATYSERIYLSRTLPEGVNWWYDFRITSYHPTGWVNSTIYDFSGFRPYVNAVYLRGAAFLDEIRVLVGDQTFEDFLAAYARKYNGEIATGEDFFSELNSFAPDRLDTLVEEYFQP